MNHGISLQELYVWTHFLYETNKIWLCFYTIFNLYLKYFIWNEYNLYCNATNDRKYEIYFFFYAFPGQKQVIIWCIQGNNTLLYYTMFVNFKTKKNPSLSILKTIKLFQHTLCTQWLILIFIEVFHNIVIYLDRINIINDILFVAIEFCTSCFFAERNGPLNTPFKI